jgi:predicted DNA-binding transcriptional regulator AlpA
MSTEVLLDFKLITLSQLADHIGVHRSTIYRKLKKRGIQPPGELLGPKWVEIIVKILNDLDVEFEKLPKESTD